MSRKLIWQKDRGRAIDLEGEKDIMVLINNMAASLAEGKMSYKDFVIKLCEVCRLISGKGLMCKLHKNFDPSIDIEKCERCSVVMLRCL